MRINRLFNITKTFLLLVATALAIVMPARGALADDIASGTWGTCPWEVSSDGVLTVHPGVGRSQRNADYSPWNDYCSDIVAVVFAGEGGRKVVLPADSHCLLADLYNVQNIDASGLDVSSVVNMSSMFTGCSSLVSLDVSGWDTSSTTNMGGVFYGCSSLATLNLSSWNTSRVTAMQSMFMNCSSLESLDVSKWDTSSVTDMDHMFYCCFSLASLDVSRWDTSSVVTMSEMFWRCSSLERLDVSRWNTSSAVDVVAMFWGCSTLSSLNLSGWDISGVTSMDRLFFNCSSLSALDVSDWDTSNVTDMYGMFCGCSSLSSLDLLSWDVSSVELTANMFRECTSLSSISVGSGWTMSAVSASDNMFDGCTSLVGGNGTKYDAGHTDATYARADAPGMPGYLTSADEGGLDLLDLCFSFANTSLDFGYDDPYYIGVDAYRMIWGDAVGTVVHALHTFDKCRGNCFGMSYASALMAVPGSGLAPSDFNPSAPNPYALYLSDTHAETSGTLRDYIEALQVSQWKLELLLRDCGLEDLCAEVQAGRRSGRPVLVNLYGFSEGNHSVLAYDIEVVGDTETRIQVYDPNCYYWEKQFISITTTPSGRCTGWHYKSGSHEWGSEDSLSAINYIPFSDLQDAWDNRGTSAATSLVNILAVGSPSFRVTGATGEVVALVQDGVLTEAADGVSQHFDLAAGDGGGGIVALYVPRESDYVVMDLDGSVGQLVAGVVGDGQAACVITEASEVTFAFDEGEVTNLVEVAAADGDAYAITVASDLEGASGLKLIELSGVCAGDGVSAGTIEGSLVVDGEQGAMLTVNGDEFDMDPLVDISCGEASLEYASCPYDGAPHKPRMTVSLGGSVLVEGRDYVVRYVNNVEAGIATVTAYGTGDYTGSRAVEFQIVDGGEQPGDNMLRGLVEVDGEQVWSTDELHYADDDATTFEGVTFHLHSYFEDDPIDYDTLNPILDACSDASGLNGFRSVRLVERLWLEDANGDEIDVNDAGIGDVHVRMVTDITGVNDPNLIAVVHYDRNAGVATKLNIISVEQDFYTNPDTGEQYPHWSITYEGTLAQVMDDMAIVCAEDHVDIDDNTGAKRPFYHLRLDAGENAPVRLPAGGFIDGESYNYVEGGLPRYTYIGSFSDETIAFDSTRDILFYVPVDMGYVLDSVTYSVGDGAPVSIAPSGSTYSDWTGAEYDLYVIPAVEDVVTIATSAHKGYVVNDDGTVTFDEATGLPDTAYKLGVDLAEGANASVDAVYAPAGGRVAFAVKNASGETDYYLWPDKPSTVYAYASNEYRLAGEPALVPADAGTVSIDETEFFLVTLTAPATLKVEAELLEYVQADEDANTGVTVDVPKDIAEQFEELTLVVEPETEAGPIEAAMIAIAENEGNGFSPDELIMYDIHYENAEGEEVTAPTSETGDVMRVTLPVPEGWDTSKVRVYYLMNYTFYDGTTEVIPQDVGATPNADGTAMVFYTSHFSDYAMALDAEWTPVVIDKIDISDAVITVEGTLTYTGSALCPAINVKLGGTPLELGADYTVEYSDNVEVGTATITVTGVGAYTGTASTTFEIVAPLENPFRDVTEKTPHYEDILWLADAGISRGWAEKDGTRTFRGGNGVQRGDMAAFLYRLAGSPEYVPTAEEMAYFSDVRGPDENGKGATPHYKEIWWLASTGITKGWTMKDGTHEFRPSNTVVRQDMAAFLYRLAGSPDYEPTAEDLAYFSDVSGPDANGKGATPHYREICWLASTGVTRGWTMKDGTHEFRGKNTVVRQDMAAFLHRMSDKALVKTDW